MLFLYYIWMKKLLISTLFFTVSFLYANTINFTIKSDFPAQTPWIKKMLERSSTELNKMFLNPNVKIPKTITVRIKKDMRLKSIAGNARKFDNSINFRSNVWQKDKYRIWIMIHELINLLSSYYGSDGYPSDWWSNGRSPFPEYVAVLVMAKLGYKKEALWRKSVHQDKNDHKFYWTLHKQFGTKLFKDFFALMKKHNIKLDKIGKPWPHPDKQRSLTALALLSLASNKNLANLARHYKIGDKPKDWEKRHPEIKFIPYTIFNEELKKKVDEILN